MEIINKIKNAILSNKVLLVIAFVGFSIVYVILNYVDTRPYFNNGTLIVANDGSFEPFGYYDDDSKLVGFDIDIMEAVAKASGYYVKIVDKRFVNIIPSVAGGVYDVAISSITITDERKKIVDFTIPYFQNSISVAVLKKIGDIRDFSDLNGRIVGVEADTTNYDYAMENLKDSIIIKFDTTIDLEIAFKKGLIDAMVNDTPVIQFYIKNYSNNSAVILPSPTKYFDIGIAVRKNHPKLLKNLNKGIKRMKSNGDFDKIYKKWFSVEEKKEKKMPKIFQPNPVKIEFKKNEEVKVAPKKEVKKVQNKKK
ncbi:MAG: basic amino acid ABC transporter substrate-binding protein [Rickettsiales bacterium]|nr:MAG: basic amino acid ABC transporter substrate-binding protein [Rickettsiales bacterium]